MVQARPWSDEASRARMLDRLPLAAIGTDLDGTVSYWNAAAEALYGWTCAEALGHRIDELTVADISQEHGAEIMAALRAGVPWSGEFTVRRKDGSTFLAMVHDTGVYDCRGELLGILGISSDISSLIRPLLWRSADAALVVDRHGTITWSSPAIATLLGWSEDEIVGSSALTLVHPLDRIELREFLARLLSSPGPHPPVELRLRRPDRTWTWVEAATTNLLTDPVVKGVVCNLRDASARREVDEQLRHLALHDPLTGIANRALVTDRIEHALLGRDRRGALLFVDLDEFKTINDALGHGAGDEALRLMAARLSSVVRPEDTCGRIGGDEFVVLTSSTTDETGALGLADRIHSVVDEPMHVGGVEVVLSASIGVALLDERPTNAELLLRQADLAMYRAKHRGPGRTELYRPGPDSGRWNRLHALRDLRHALERRELELDYQPIVALTGRRSVGVEALVRWRHPVQGRLLPDEFIGLAETSGLIHDLGAWVLHEACQQLGSWRDIVGAPLSLSVNVSARQLIGDDLVPLVRSALDDAAIDPEVLCVEVTETALSEDLDAAMRTLRTLKDLGVRVAIDDFGTGHAGFAYLKRLPADELKIDRSFVVGLGRHHDDAAIVDGVVHLAHGLGLTTVAEGVETPEQAAILAALGCDRAQGNLWSMPVPVERLLAHV